LTPRQNEIALLLANGATTTAISQKLGLHMSTVSTFKSIIYRKLNVQNVVQLGSLLA
jgi:DNA-binding NarL/FixJ family response regulator